MDDIIWDDMNLYDLESHAAVVRLREATQLEPEATRTQIQQLIQSSTAIAIATTGKETVMLKASLLSPPSIVIFNQPQSIILLKATV